MQSNRRCRDEYEVPSVSDSISRLPAKTYIRPALKTVLALYLIGALTLGPVAAAQASAEASTAIDSDVNLSASPDDGDLLNESDDSTNTTETVDDTTDSTTGTVDETTETIEETVNETTDTVDGTVNETTDTVDGTVDETTETLNETSDGSLDDTTGAINETVDDTTDTLDNTTDSLENTTDETIEGATNGTVVSTGELLNTTLVTGLESSAAEGSSTVDGEPESGDADSVRSDRAGDAAASDRDAINAGESSGEEEGPTIPAPAAAAGVGAVVIGAAGATALSGSGSAATSPGVTRSVTMGARNAATDARTLLGRLGDKLWKIGAVLRYSRWDDSDPLEHDLRREIYDTVDDAPGIYLSKIDERTDRSLSSLRHHLRILEEENLITTEKVRGKRRYFPVTRGGDDPTLVAALDDPATESILTTLAEEGPSSGGDLADALDRDPSTVSHHLSRLEEEGLVERERDGRSVVNKLSDSAAMALSDAPAASVDAPAPADD